MKSKPIKGFENEYIIYENGDVFSIKRNIFRKPYNSHAGRGYLVIDLYHGNNRDKKVSIHRLIAEHFIPNPLNKKEVNHINGDTFDNRIENLEWVTHQENIQHAVDKLGAKLGFANCVEKMSYPVIQYDLDGNKIQMFPSIAEASRKTNTCASYIRGNLIGNYKQAKGFIYKYEDPNMQTIWMK